MGTVVSGERGEVKSRIADCRLMIADWKTAGAERAPSCLSICNHQSAICDQVQLAFLTADSHFVSLAFSAGCDTNRCQITPWNASACGVTLAAFTVGTMTQASATFAV